MKVKLLPRLNPWALSGAAMITWAGYVILLGVLAGFGVGTPLVTGISSLYVGYNTTPAGLFRGLLWASIDGFFAGLIFALVYNLISSKFGSKN